MNKIKIFNEQERVKLEFDFDNVESARQYFSDEECINDIVGLLGDNEAEVIETPSEIEQKMKLVKEQLRELFGKASISFLSEVKKIVDESIESRK